MAFSLFTTPATAAPAPAPSATAGGPVVEAVRQGAARSGATFDFLLRAARKESALDPEAKASTSSATGLFQFIEQTWLAMVKSDGAKHGLGQYAEAITTTSGGRLTVADPALRAEILGLRRDPQVSSALAGELANRNGAALADALGRPATDGELYLAHVFGARGAISLIRKAGATPDEKAASHFPDEASANRGVFYARGRARSLAEVRDALAAGFGATDPAATTAVTATEAPAASGAWLSFFPVFAGASASRPMDALYRTEGAGPVSPAVARLWTGRDPGAASPPFYPTGAGGALDAPASEARVAPPATVADPSPAAPARSRRNPGKPLDLQAHMKPIAT